MAPKVALIQNHVGLDGRSQTLVSLVELLNARQIVPDILTFSGRQDAERFRSLSSLALEFKLRSFRKPPLLAGDLLQEFAIPYLFRGKLKSYDLVFASNTAIYGYPKEVELLRLVCFPLEQVSTYEGRYKEPAYRIYGFIHKVLCSIASHRTSYHGRWLANSEFTREVMEATYPLAGGEIEVVYAPVSTEIAGEGAARERSVVTIGGFHPDKRQLDQIEMARQLPDVKFYLIGSTRSSRYLRQCQEAANAAPNVQLIPNASRAQITDILSRAKVYLHTKQYEHFGIGTVEGIAHGCVPIVHDSGGQREVVPYSEMRFADSGEAVRRIRSAVDGDFDKLLPDLQTHIQSYSQECFKTTMARILDDALGEPVSKTISAVEAG